MTLRFPRFGNDWGTVASVAGLLVAVALIFVNNRAQIYIALALILIGVLAVNARVWWITGRILNAKYPRGYMVIASSVRYSTTDARTIKLTTHKTIQCKSPVLQSFNHEFSWSGTKDPGFSSDHQTFKGVTKTTHGDYDIATFAFQNPLRYNDTEIVQIHFELDDTDQKSGTYIEFRVDEPSQLIDCNVELYYDAGKARADAVVHKIRLSTGISTKIADVPFDQLRKSYTWHQPQPAPDYAYRVEWER